MLLPHTFRFQQPWPPPPFPQVGERQSDSFSSSSSICPRNSNLARNAGSSPISWVRREHGGACPHGDRSTERSMTRVPALQCRRDRPAGRPPISMGSFHGERPSKARLPLPISGDHRSGGFWLQVSTGRYAYQLLVHGLLNAAACLT